MKARLIKSGTDLKFSDCRLRALKMDVTLFFTLPDTELRSGEEISLKLSSGDILSFIVDGEMSQRAYSARLKVMEKLSKMVEISAQPKTDLSNLAQNELSGVLVGAFSASYSLNQFVFSGTLFRLISTIERLANLKAYLQAEGVAFNPPAQTLTVGKLLNEKKLTSTRLPFQLLNSFSLLPCTVQGKTVRELEYNFRNQTVEALL